MSETKPSQVTFPIDVGGLKINSGYLSSYSWSAGAHGIFQVNASFSFYEDFNGAFTPNILEDEDRDWYKASDLTVSLAGIDISSKIESISYSESHNFEPLYDISGSARNSDNPIPVEIRYGEKTKSLSLDTYNIFEAIPYTGKNITVEVGVRGQPSKWKVNGVLMSKDVSINFGQKLTSSLQIEENGYGSEPDIQFVWRGDWDSFPNNKTDLYAGQFCFIYGNNLQNTTAVYFNNEISTTDFKMVDQYNADNSVYVWTDYIYLKIPRFARSGPIRVVTSNGEARSAAATINNQINRP